MIEMINLLIGIKDNYKIFYLNKDVLLLKPQRDSTLVNMFYLRCLDNKTLNNDMRPKIGYV